ncbi:MAG TPA: PAS domain-containing sensor histidine kinase [Haliangiales bacterium]|nr:PAS domain-containing sensor histidine kinase [Haliangiales bacterium]
MKADFQRLLDAVPDAVVVVATDGTIMWANAEAEATFGWPRDELVGHPIEILVPPRAHAAHVSHRRRFFDTNSARITVDVSARRRDGSEIDVEVSVGRPIMTVAGPLVVATARDLSARKRLDEMKTHAAALEAENVRIQEASRLKNEFLATMSHELRTPLNAILGFAELLRDSRLPAGAPEHAEYLEDILSSGRHLLGLIDDVLDLSKVDAGKLEFIPDKVDVPSLVREVGAIVRPMAAAKRIRVDVQVEPGLKVLLDPDRLKQVIYNYVVNAVRFTPEDGWVLLGVRSIDPQRFRIEVEDSGPGMAPADMARVYSEFVPPGSPPTKGTGLGLALSKKLVDAQGGSVGVKSSAAGGTILFAVLPRRARRSTRDL